jgi:hypothetical protein
MPVDRGRWYASISILGSRTDIPLKPCKGWITRGFSRREQDIARDQSSAIELPAVERDYLYEH